MTARGGRGLRAAASSVGGWPCFPPTPSTGWPPTPTRRRACAASTRSRGGCPTSPPRSCSSTWSWRWRRCRSWARARARRWSGCCPRGHVARAQPRRALPAGLRSRARPPGAAGAARWTAPWRRWQPCAAGAAVQRQPRRRRRGAPARGCRARGPRRGGPGAGRRRAARHGVDGGRPDGLRGRAAGTAWCARGRWPRTQVAARSSAGSRGRSRAGPARRRRVISSRGMSCRAAAPFGAPRSAAISISTIASASGCCRGRAPRGGRRPASSAGPPPRGRSGAAAAAASTSASPCAVLPNSSRHDPVLLREREHRLDRLAHPLGGVALAGDALADLPQERGALVVQHGQEQRLLGGEVVVQHRPRHVRPLGDLAHRGRLVARPGEASMAASTIWARRAGARMRRLTGRPPVPGTGQRIRLTTDTSVG